MIQCSICNATNEDRSTFCSECGQRLGQKPQGLVSNSDPSKSDELLQAPKLDAVPGHPSFKLHSPILDLGASEKNLDNEQIDSPDSAPRNGLHSPLLDVQNKKSFFSRSGNFGNHNSKSILPADLISQISSDANSSPSSDPGQPAKQRRSHQGLRSPLLGGEGDYRSAERVDSASNDIAGSSSKPGVNDQSIRLHSPVLDGPGGGSRGYANNEQNINQITDEYDSLRSPILAAKVPLPEKSEISQDFSSGVLTPNQTSNQPLESLNKSLREFPDDKNFSEFRSDAQSTSTAGQQTIQSILNANAGQWRKLFLSLLALFLHYFLISLKQKLVISPWYPRLISQSIFLASAMPIRQIVFPVRRQCRRSVSLNSRRLKKHRCRSQN